MKFWEQFKKKPNLEGYQEYHHEKGQYRKPDAGGEATPGTAPISREADPAALNRLFEDAEVKARMEAELGRSSNTDKESFPSLLGKGASTLGKSIKKVSNGRGVLDEDDETDGEK